MNATLKVNGLAVDTQAIADGLYDIICAKGEEAIVAFGMIPAWLIETLELMLREKAIAIAAAQVGVTVQEFGPFIDETKLKETIRPIVHEVTVGIYRAASSAGRMCV